MSAVVHAPEEAAAERQALLEHCPWTPAAFERFVLARESAGDPYTYELIGGQIHVSPPPGTEHALVELHVGAAIFLWAQAHGGRCGTNGGFRLPDGSTVGPDVFWISSERYRPPAESRYAACVPELLVEVLSEGSTDEYDRGAKRELYARSGVRELWLVDPRTRTVTVCALERPELADEVFARGVPVRSRVLPGVGLVLA